MESEKLKRQGGRGTVLGRGKGRERRRLRGRERRRGERLSEREKRRRGTENISASDSWWVQVCCNVVQSDVRVCV